MRKIKKCDTIIFGIEDVALREDSIINNDYDLNDVDLICFNSLNINDIYRAEIIIFHDKRNCNMKLLKLRG